MAVIPPKWPFAAHAAIETAAALTLMLAPGRQLPGCPPAARPILRQYGALLLATNLVCVAVLLDPGQGPSGFGRLPRLIAAALAFYHVWPCFRAYARLCAVAGLGGGAGGHDDDKRARSILGGPAVHLAVHLLCFVMFVSVAVFGDGN